MRIKKLYIENFKSVAGRAIIDFDSTSVFILNGPNGFGKTSIFDAIEICLRDGLYRIEDQIEVSKAIDKRSVKPRKPFYQNKPNSPVTIKVLLEKQKEDDTTEILSIVKHDPGNQQNYNYSQLMFNTYIFRTEEGFNEIFEAGNQEPESNPQGIINAFLELGDDRKMEDIYLMFNYLQQDENTYFLKQSEFDRKRKLDFLFKTEKEYALYQKVHKYWQGCNTLKREIEEKIKSFTEQSKKTTEKKYQCIFSENHFNFDVKDPFEECEFEDLNQELDLLILEIDKLIKFKREFKIEDFKKKRRKDYLLNLAENEKALELFIVKKVALDQDLFLDVEAEQQEFEDSISEEFIKTFLLQDFLEEQKFSELKTISLQYDKYRDFLYEKADNEYYEETSEDFRIKNLNQFFKGAELESLVALQSQINSIKEELGQNGRMIIEINKLRDNLLSRFSHFKSHKEEVHACPLCGYDWKEYSALKEEFDKKTALFEVVNKDLIGQRKKKLEVLKKDFLAPVNKKGDKFLQEHAYIGEIFYIVEELYDDLEEDWLKRIQAFSKGYSKQPKLIELKNITEEVLTEKIDLVKRYLEENQPFSEEIIQILADSQSDEGLLEDVQKLEKYPNANNFCLPKKIDELRDYKKVQSKSQELRKFLINEAEKIRFNSKNAEDHHEEIFMDYFDEDQSLLKSVSLSNLTSKKSYLEFKVYQRKTSYSANLKTTLTELEGLIAKLDNLRNLYSNEIKMFKKDMIRKIKLPFFIYTAKILQNYPQGMGVFITTKERDGNENDFSIRFSTTGVFKHDAIHNLSSGQLAVVSLAFCLAINKTYRISKYLRFLTIDDPIQEMDSLNVHSFLELMRHEFINDYQIIISTHDDVMALYMKYKLSKFSHIVKTYNVHRELFVN